MRGGNVFFWYFIVLFHNNVTIAQQGSTISIVSDHKYIALLWRYVYMEYVQYMLIYNRNLWKTADLKNDFLNKLNNLLDERKRTVSVKRF